ncbi:TOM1-like protein 6 isoform X1 [Gossypium hirsutum]|uniref:TOM1-like protein 6 isoform X1 n=1 Tax=Gossypium hirsutum TaxID=3635 RepID=A0ABM2YWF7_GOSHI|nr:TOM1-like protein 6 isoform X1 [Gossypium hirsutum]
MLIMPQVSSSAATVAVDKATSELLNAPDWTLNIDICDSLNSNHWQRKDIVKAVKRRLQHKNSRVQLLALTLLETMLKNCGDYVHYHIDERNILGEMVKIVKRKFVQADIAVREKILGLLDSWQEAFGGRKGEHPEYHWACQELRRSGMSFPERSPNAVPILTSAPKHHPCHGMPSNSSRRLDEPTDTERLSFDSLKDVMDLLADMLHAVNPRDPTAVKDEVIVDLVNQCRSNQKKLMHTLTTTGDEELLARGLELNDVVQSLLAKHDAICSSSPLTMQVTTSLSSKPSEASTVEKSNEAKSSSPASKISPPASVAIVTRNLIDEDEEEEEDFAQLTRRHSRAESRSSQSTSAGTNESLLPIKDTVLTTSYDPTLSATDELCNALALPSDLDAEVNNTKEQDLIDLLSLTLSTSSSASPSHAPYSSPSANIHHKVQAPFFEGYPYPENKGSLPYDSYIVPWAQPQPQFRRQFQAESLTQTQSNSLFLGQQQPQSLLQPQYSSGYPLPQWAATPGYFTGRNHLSSANNMHSTQKPNAASTNPMEGNGPLQHSNSWATPMLAQKPYIPPYRLFEDLNVLGDGDGRLKVETTTSTESMIGGKK